MRLFVVSQLLLVFISVLALTRAQITTETTTAQPTETSTDTATTETTTAQTTQTTTETTTTAATTETTTAQPTQTTTVATTVATTAQPTQTTTEATTVATTAQPTQTTTEATTLATTAQPTQTTTQTTTDTTTTGTTTPAIDPCYNYTVLNDEWRSTSNQLQLSFFNELTSKVLCDTDVNWHGWYRLFIQGQSVQMPDTCVDERSCGTHAPLWLDGGHPTVEDGVVTRPVCGNWLNNCCFFRSNPIKVKACPGNFYVYELVQPIACYLTYCADVRNSSINNATFTPNTTLAAPGIFYPFGSSSGDTINPAEDDGSSSVIPLLSPFLFFGRTYQQIYVNNNGHLTFNQPSRQYDPYSFPNNGGQDIIAGLWTDLDNRVRGVVSYHQYTNGSVLTRATQDINNHFPNLAFSASWVFVATWNKVSYYPITTTETSFQVVLISGTHFSFILMNYGDIAVTGHPVEAGYDTVNTDYFVIPGSINGSFISNLKNSSNVNVPGRWAFRVDTSNNNVIGLQMKLSSFLDLTQSGNIEIVLQQIKQVLVNNNLPSNIELKLRKVQKTTSPYF